MSNVKSRYYNFFRPDGKALILALDHGGNGNINLENPGKPIAEAVAAGVDGVLTTYGIIKKYRSEIGRAGCMLRVDMMDSGLGEHTLAGQYIGFEPDVRWNVEEALKLGIDGVMCMAFLGMPKVNGVSYDCKAMKLMSDVAQICDKYGLVSAAEVLPRGKSKDPNDRTTEAMMMACRAAAESGIDVIKTEFVNGVDEFSRIVKNTYAPMLALGGVKTDDVRALLQQCRDAMDAGCKGLAIGRNIWGADNVGNMVRSLVKIIHEDASVDEAMKELNK